MTDKKYEAIILSGGSSSRMKLESEIPKQLLPIFNNRCILQYQIEWLNKHGIKQIVMAIDKFTYDYLLDNMPWLLQMADASIETQKLGTGGAIKKALRLVRSDTVYAMNVDDFILSAAYTPYDLLEALNPGFTLAILTSRGRFPYGIIKSRGRRVRSFVQKPLMDYKVSAGHYAFNVKMVKNKFPDYGQFEDVILPELAKEGHVTFVDLDGIWTTVNTFKEYKIAQRTIDDYQKRLKYGTDTRSSGFKGYGRVV